MTDDSLARRRFATLGLLRFAGVAVAMLGLVLLGDRLSLVDPAIDAVLGGALVLAGMMGVLVFPTWLVRRWKRSDGR